MKTKFCTIENLVIVDDFILNEQTIDSYLCKNIHFNLFIKFSLAIFEEIINRMIPYISKMHDNKDFLTSGLLLEELNVKEFDKTKVNF